MANLYKAYQLASFFCIRYGYRKLFINGTNPKDELFVYNNNNPEYQIVRISVKNFENSYYEDDRMNVLKDALGKRFKIDNVKVLEIYVSKNEVTSLDRDNVVCIDEDFYSGIDLSNIYPGIKEVIHHVSNESAEISKLVFSMNRNISKTNGKGLIKNKFKESFVTYSVLIICVIVYFLSSLIASKGFDQNSVYIALGADYKTFTLGLHQFYRLITYSFVHGGIAHLLCNSYSLILLGPIIEKKYGHMKFLLVLFGCVLFGSLCYGSLSSNTICMGISAGLYGLMSVYILSIVENYDGILPRNLAFIIFLNLMMNFIPGVAWQAHLGGAIFGLLFYYMFKNEKLDKVFLLLTILVFGVLGFKYVSNSDINPLYLGTDREVVRVYKEYLPESFTTRLKNDLVKLYLEEGAIYYE